MSEFDKSQSIETGKEREPTSEKVALLFPGQGAQVVGMGKELYESSERGRRIINRAGEILGYNLKQIMFHGPKEALDDIFNAQLATHTHNLAWLAAFLEQHPELRVKTVAGHSLGEYAALVAARVITLKESLELVRERARVTTEQAKYQPGGMAALLGLGRDTVMDLCKQTGVTFANDNAVGQSVVSGEQDALHRVMELAKHQGAKVRQLQIQGAFHSPLMEGARELLAQYIQHNIHFRDAQIPVIPNATLKKTTVGQEIKEAILANMTGGVPWVDTMGQLANERISIAYEVGGRVLSGLNKRIPGSVTTKAIDTIEALQERIEK